MRLERSLWLVSVLFLGSWIAFEQNILSAREITWHGNGKGGAVAAGHASAVQAGIATLEQGGNAADAAAATILALSVTDYGSFAIGGEVPILIYDTKSNRVKSLSGIGAAPLAPEAIKWFYENGIPSKGSMKAAPTPSAVDAVVTLLRIYGTISFEQAVAPTLELLDKGKEDWHPNLAVTLRKLVESEKKADGTREQKLTTARDRFYRGDVADELEAWYIETGAWLRKRDLEAHVTLVEEPVSTVYRGYTVYKCGTWTQGPVLCQSLELLEGFDLGGMKHMSADFIHVVTEAMKLSFADRAEYYGDPRFVQVPMAELLSEGYTQLRRKLIDMRVASMARRPGDPLFLQVRKGDSQPKDSREEIPKQDTTTCVVADRWGNVVAATPSCNLLTNKPGPSGVNTGNRVRSLNTTPNHPNRVEAGKRPRITLTPTLVMKNGKPVMAISVAGGDLQDQTTLNVLLNHIHFGMRPADAVTSDRFSTAHHQDSFDPNPDREAAFVERGALTVYADLSEDIREELSRRGHIVKTTNGPIAHPVMIYIDQQSGQMYAAGDPKAKRHAAAIKSSDE
ncbi:MAG: gamma-glutamyltransferase [Pirellula sp.]